MSREDHRTRLLGCSLAVDQVREVLVDGATASAPPFWERDEAGRWTLSFPPMIAVYAGAGLYLPRVTAQRMISVIAGGMLDLDLAPPISESQQALFWTMLLAEPEKRGGSLTRGLLLFSHALSGEDGNENLIPLLHAPDGDALSLLSLLRPACVSLLGEEATASARRAHLHRLLIAELFGSAPP